MTAGNIIFFNKAAERIFGFSAADMIGEPLTLLMPERFHTPHERGMVRFLETGSASAMGKTSRTSRPEEQRGGVSPRTCIVHLARGWRDVLHRVSPRHKRAQACCGDGPEKGPVQAAVLRAVPVTCAHP